MSARVHQYVLQRGEGAYQVTALTGALSGVAAGTATAGHLCALRWAPAAPNVNNVAVMRRLRVQWWTVAGFTAAQQVGFDVFVLRGYTAAHSGGTTVTMTGNNAKKRTAFGTPQMAIQVSTTAELTAGTQTLDAQPIASGRYSELAAAATVGKGVIDVEVTLVDAMGHPLVLAANEGLLVRNTVAMGAGGTAQVAVTADWLEMKGY